MGVEGEEEKKGEERIDEKNFFSSILSSPLS
jgi:hypothetical protein